MNWATIVQIAIQILPGLLGQSAPWVSSAVSAVIAYDHDTVKWLQGALNQLIKPSPLLTVDGVFGPKTKAAVGLAEQHFGILPTGTVGYALILAVGDALKLLPKT